MVACEEAMLQRRNLFRWFPTTCMYCLLIVHKSHWGIIWVFQHHIFVFSRRMFSFRCWREFREHQITYRKEFWNLSRRFAHLHGRKEEKRSKPQKFRIMYKYTYIFFLYRRQVIDQFGALAFSSSLSRFGDLDFLPSSSAVPFFSPSAESSSLLGLIRRVYRAISRSAHAPSLTSADSGLFFPSSYSFVKSLWRRLVLCLCVCVQQFTG